MVKMRTTYSTYTLSEIASILSTHEQLRGSGSVKAFVEVEGVEEPLIHFASKLEDLED